ncbi:sugar ABC transporter ATP-binding protein [Mesorhizobium sp. CN2-181]|uniref:sugar ABC transporter ATP-binding protein n=1 Tax=Mesorhizobium yinganensis TaxID=3157707 RepID=UPI0032B85994
MSAVLAGRGLTRSFGAFRALDAADIELQAGRIHALMGENGAGKSTLIKLLGGIYQPDAGKILIDGHPSLLPSPKVAARTGIRIVHQERHLIPDFSVAENILLNEMPLTRSGLIDFSAANRIAEKLLDRLGIGIAPHRDVATLSAAQQQQVEIARVLHGTSRVVILDEPTASLTPVEADQLFTLLRKLAAAGVAILFVSHKIDEVYALCEMATVLRDGRVVERARPLSEFPVDDLVKAMVGRSIEAGRRASPRHVAGPPLVELAGVATELGHKGIDLAVRPGEIHGLYGLVGSGRTELAHAVLGDVKVTAGSIVFAERDGPPESVTEAVRHFRIGHVSEDRKREGLALDQPIRANACAAAWRRIASRWGWVERQNEEDAVAGPLRELDLTTSDLSLAAATLSGGNQQKVSVAKWLVADPRLMIFDEPTIGVDVAAKETLHRHIRKLAEDGCGVLLISSDLAEVITLSDRISIMSNFRIVGLLENSGDYADMSVRAMRAIQAATAWSSASWSHQPHREEHS